MTEYPNWFAQTAQGNFEHFLTPLAGKSGLQFLQLGAYTGDATQWLCEKILTGEGSWLHDVDTWQGSNEPAHDEIDFNEVRKIYKSRIAMQPVTSWVDNTTHYLIDTAREREDRFDFIYVDADHTTVGVILDAELSWLLLKSGGIMAFDDYTWGHESGDPRLAPQVGIDLFLHRHVGDYELLIKNNQVWIRKH